MLRPRIIPCLTIDENSDFVKTTNFGNRKYIGDVLNSIKIFNEKDVDEIIVLDIDASIKKKKPDLNLIEKIASVCRMPLCYGGGIKSVDDVIKILNLGVEKVSLNSKALEDPKIINQIAKKIGSQSVAVCIDIKQDISSNNFNIYLNNGTKILKKNLKDVLLNLQDEGVGEIIINSIDKDGTMEGFDLEFLEKFQLHIKVPCTLIGGAGSYDDIAKLFKSFKVVGAGCGSLFIYKGVHRAVLINYPNLRDKLKIIEQ